MPKRTKKEMKMARWNDFQEACLKFTKCLFVEVDNVTSKQISTMRKELRAIGAKMIMGKNTHFRAALADITVEPDKKKHDDYEERMKTWKPRPYLNIIRDQLVGNVGLIFSNDDLTAIKDILDTHVRAAPARVASIAPKNVTVPPGPTGMDPKQTGFFQALNIQTKIVKAQIEIVNEVQVITEGEKISASQAALLDKLKIHPFEYKMVVKAFMENGQLYNAKVLSITSEQILETFSKNASNLTALSLGSGYTIAPAVPHLISNAFKNLACAAMAADYDFPQLAALKSAAAAAPASGGAAAGGAAKEEAPKEAEKEPEEDVDMGGLFGGDDDDY